MDFQDAHDLSHFSSPSSQGASHVVRVHYFPCRLACCGVSPQGRQTLPSSDQVLPQAVKVYLVFFPLVTYPLGECRDMAIVLFLREWPEACIFKACFPIV